MIRKTMFLGEYAAEFHLDHKSAPPRYNYAIVRRHTRTLLFWGNGDSIAEVMRVALERLQRYHPEPKTAGPVAVPSPPAEAKPFDPEKRIKMKAAG